MVVGIFVGVILGGGLDWLGELRVGWKWLRGLILWGLVVVGRG